MILTYHHTLADHPFQHCCNKLTHKPQVTTALSTLSTDYHLNRNVLLFCCWFGYCGQGRLYKRDFKEILQAIHPWHEYTVQGLGNITQLLADKQAPHWAAPLHQAIQEEQQIALQMEQLMIAEAAGRKRRKRSPQQKYLDAWHNLNSYMNTAGVSLRPTHTPLLDTLLSVVFPDVEPPLDLDTQTTPHSTQLSLALF